MYLISISLKITDNNVIINNGQISPVVEGVGFQVVGCRGSPAINNGKQLNIKIIMLNILK